jgi:hypothetical protein
MGQQCPSTHNRTEEGCKRLWNVERTLLINLIKNMENCNSRDRILLEGLQTNLGLAKRNVYP